jgi:hypothetical protein
MRYVKNYFLDLYGVAIFTIYHWELNIPKLKTPAVAGAIKPNVGDSIAGYDSRNTGVSQENLNVIYFSITHRKI